MPIYTIGRLKRQEAFCYTYKHNLLYFIIAIENDLQCVSTTFSSTIVISGPLSIFQALCQYSKILVYTCISKIFCSRTVILQLLVVQVVWFLLQFLCLRCIARSAYVQKKLT